jgi:GH25 family lysozyme M1 (1,4-beta-N-acetylmuramidase)
MHLPTHGCLPQVCRNAEQQESFVTLLLAASASLNTSPTPTALGTTTAATNTTTMTASETSTTTSVGGVGVSDKRKGKDWQMLRRAEVFVMTSSAVDLDSPNEPNDLNGGYNHSFTNTL